MKFMCPCCGYYTLKEAPPGTYDICKVCFWEDDYVQYIDPTYEGGANRDSLNQARRNYLELGVSNEKFISFVRKPHDEELPENNQ